MPYFAEGLEQAEQVVSIRDATDSGEKSHTRVRTCGEMSWALRNLSGTEQLMEYEARVNQLLPKHDCTLMCVYDVNKFSGRVLLDALSTHPHVIVNGKLVKNQYFVPRSNTSRAAPAARPTPSPGT